MPPFDGGISKLSIPVRLVLLSCVLLAILIGVSTYLSRELNDSTEALAAEARYVDVLRSAGAAEKSFGDLKYWLTDLSVSLLNRSEENANEAKRALEAQLSVLDLYDGRAVESIRREVERLTSRALEAVEAYTAERRVIGNSLMAQARVHIAAVDQTLSSLASKLREEAEKASAAAQEESEQAVRTSGFVVLFASLFALALTILVLRSIMIPLGQIRGAIAALTAGRSDVVIPDMGRHETGAIGRALSMFRDGLVERDRLAAEREEAMQRLEVARDEATASSRILQVTFDHMAQGVSMFDREHRLVAWNRQFRELLELPDQLLAHGLPYVDLIRYLILRGDFGEGEVEEQIRRRLAGIERSYLGERTRPDGTIFEIRRTPVATGGFVTMYTDITDRKRSQIEIERSNRRLTDAIESISDGFALWDRDNWLVTSNDRCKVLLKLPDVFAPGLRFEDFLRAVAQNRVRPSASAEETESWVAQQLALHRNPPVEQELELVGGAWLRAAARRTDEGGNVTTWADITALKHREIELADLVEKLEAARDEANEANRTKSAFLANMSHELRTPLNAIIGYSEILKEEANDQDLPDFLPDLDRIEGAGRHLLGVINDILDLSKIEAGRMDVYIEDFDIEDLIGQVQAIIEPLAEKNGNELDIRCPADIGSMRSDLTKVKQSLLNLLSNSSKFTSNGRLSLDVLRVEDEAGASLRFSVTDTGIGMSKEQMGKLFQAFSQADTTTTKRFGGTGLGLAITRHFCDMLGGSVTVESELGKGSTFVMIIPDRALAGEAKPGIAALQPRKQAAPDGAPTVLVVDDDMAVLDLLGLTLGKEGYRVIHARSGEEAMRLAREHRPDAITLDVVMPHMDGWSVLSALKADPELSDIPVIMVTMLKDRGMALTLGAADFMTKPVDRASLLAILKRHCPNPAGAPVLVVDDDEAARESARRVLDKAGYAVAEARNGAEALKWLRANAAPALILLDLVMPVMDGFAFLDAMRDHPAAPSVPIVILTAKQLSAEEKQNLTGRVEEVLTKDRTTPVDLADAVRRSVKPPDRAAAERDGSSLLLGH